MPIKAKLVNLLSWKRFHASCVNLGPVELQKIESGNDFWYCSNCKAESSLCSGAVLNSHKAVQCDM